mmetsp:Transcript_4969/g.16291  ORF Transcript_4969/g.16291 Transcript_4969/m.16291 type:complete len:228 (-) Transcript_4969:440-1123(-)
MVSSRASRRSSGGRASKSLGASQAAVGASSFADTALALRSVALAFLCPPNWNWSHAGLCLIGSELGGLAPTTAARHFGAIFARAVDSTCFKAFVTTSFKSTGSASRSHRFRIALATRRGIKPEIATVDVSRPTLSHFTPANAPNLGEGARGDEGGASSSFVVVVVRTLAAAAAFRCCLVVFSVFSAVVVVSVWCVVVVVRFSCGGGASAPRTWSPPLRAAAIQVGAT